MEQYYSIVVCSRDNALFLLDGTLLMRRLLACTFTDGLCNGVLALHDPLRGFRMSFSLSAFRVEMISHVRKERSVETQGVKMSC